MKSVGFTGEISENGQLAIPSEIVSILPPHAKLQVALHWGESDDDAWRRAGRRQFEAAYSADDSVYEALIDDPASRSVPVNCDRAADRIPAREIVTTES
jgi:hypothetical protein